MKKFVLLLIFGGCLGWLEQAGADIICLKNGNIIEGIVIQDKDGVLELEVFLGAKVTFNKQDVTSVKRGKKGENEALRARWVRDEVERKQAELARQEFEAEQIAQGLVKYQGQWMSKTDEDKLKTREYVDEVLRQKSERGEIADGRRKNRSELASALLAKGAWRNRQTENFIVYYEDILQSKVVADRAQYYYEKITYDLDYEKLIYWPDKCEVFIISSEKKWREYMRDVQRFEHIGGFVPQSGQKEIYLCALSLPYLSVTFPHELTHLIFSEFAKGKNIPLWLNEGLAIYESGLIGYADEMLLGKVKDAKHIPIRELTELQDYPQTKEAMELFYAEAEKIVEFLITQQGREKFSRFCQRLIDGESFAKSLDAVYGDKYANPDEFNRAWIQYVLK